METAGEKFEQLRPAVPRSDGTTESEQYLAKLAELSFLDLWSYANPYRKQKVNGVGDGKELCDLIVVCDPHVIIFSEKTISWPNGATNLAWRRWYKRAVGKSLNQIRGAERWVRDFPSEIYLDPDCTIPFPIEFPPVERMFVHRVVVARGAGAACREHFGGGSGSLMLAPNIKGKAHFEGDSIRPFVVGDVDPDGPYVHVLDDATLDIILAELDTVSDFTRYLTSKETFVRSGKLMGVEGEEDLLAYYAVRTDKDGQHAFMPPVGTSWDDIDLFLVPGGEYAEFISNPQYERRREANEESYVWDGLIKEFTKHLLGGTSIVLEGYDFDLKKSEHAVRHMALEDRVSRRSFGQGILDALERGRGKDRFFRAMLPPATDGANKTGYFFLTVRYQKFMENDGGYERYRHFRIQNLRLYGEAMLMKNSHLDRVVGIAMEPVDSKVSSEDIGLMLQKEWTEEERQAHAEECKHFCIVQNLSRTEYHTTEFEPPPKRQKAPKPKTAYTGNWKERRKVKASAQKRGKLRT
jgi:hypothetical protein